MSVRARLIDSITKQALHAVRIGREVFLVTQLHDKTVGFFKSVTFTSAGTQAVVTPPSGNALQMTDLLLNAKKSSAGSVRVVFTDDTDNIDIFNADCTDAPITFAFQPTGRWLGWKDARVDIVVVGADTDPTVAIGYYFVKGEEVLDFADWDKQRG
jgi:hypothetical protein